MNNNLTQFILNIDCARVENIRIRYNHRPTIDCQVYDSYIRIRNVQYTRYDSAYYDYDPISDTYIFNKIKSKPSNNFFNLLSDLIIYEYTVYINEHDYYIWLAQQWLKCK